MWRPMQTLIQKVVLPSVRENVSKIYFSTKSRPRSTSKLTLVSASIGVLVGAGYGGYTHYKVNTKTKNPAGKDANPVLTELPNFTPHYKITSDTFAHDMHIILFQYRTCPFCCKVRSYLDARGISYEIVEVDAVLRQSIKWSEYKKVPILLVQSAKGYHQLMDSTAIISVLETYFSDPSHPLEDVIKYYPSHKYVKDGKETVEVANRYFVMNESSVINAKSSDKENEERKWRQWADNVLVHTLSPNVYRTAGEAIETFRWFERAGGWRDAFPAWECSLMVYGGAAAMWAIAKRLKKRHNIKEDARESLYDAARTWSSAVKAKKTPFFGGHKPNLADVTVYGVLSSIEGCQAFEDLKNNTDIAKWYYNTKEAIAKNMGKVTSLRAVSSSTPATATSTIAIAN